MVREVGLVGDQHPPHRRVVLVGQPVMGVDVLHQLGGEAQLGGPGFGVRDQRLLFKVLGEAVGLGVLVSKVQKTVFELVAVEVGKPEDD